MADPQQPSSGSGHGTGDQRVADTAADRPAPDRPPEQQPAGRTPDARRALDPGEDPGTLTDEEYFAAGGPDAVDSAADHGQRR